LETPARGPSIKPDELDEPDVFLEEQFPPAPELQMFAQAVFRGGICGNGCIRIANCAQHGAMPEQLLKGFELSHQRGRPRQEWRKERERELERQRQEQALRKAQTIASTMLPEWGAPTTVRVLEAAVAVARDARDSS
jgi:hypothetical protein